MTNVRQYLEGAQFPASKNELLKYAQEHHAPTDLIDCIRGLRDKQYSSIAEVTREVTL